MNGLILRHLTQLPTTVRSLLIVSLIISTVLLPGVRGIASATNCISSIAPSSQAGKDAVATAYRQWKSSYVTSNGANGQLRVQRSAGDGYDTVSEGIGYGLLFAVYNNDPATFAALWSYEQSHLDPNGLMNWQVGAGGNTTGYNAATDADEDIALALIAADKSWGGYSAPAKRQIQLIKQTEIESGSNILKPGDVWGGSNTLDPSYISPSYYRSFQAYTGDTSWNDVLNANYGVLNAIHNNTASRNTGLIPDWSTATGAPANGMTYTFGYDASRAPIRLALASGWNCDATATTLLAPLNATFHTINLNTIGSSYNLDGSQASGGNGIPLLAAAAAAATTSSDATYRSTAWNTLANTANTSYFPDSMRLFGLLASSGVLSDPLTLAASSAPTQPAPTAPAPVTGKLNIWWPSNGSTVIGTQPFKAMLENNDVANYAMYWQVDGGQLNLMRNDITDYPHKQADVNVSGWNWRSSNQYTITFVAKDASGTTIGSASTVITVRP
jgi:endo-1,4-beta-D-glucanase Y